jgi:hypothetical protein
VVSKIGLAQSSVAKATYNTILPTMKDKLVQIAAAQILLLRHNCNREGILNEEN